MLVVIGTDYTGSCKSNYHTTMTTPEGELKLCFDNYFVPLHCKMYGELIWQCK